MDWIAYLNTKKWNFSHTDDLKFAMSGSGISRAYIFLPRDPNFAVYPTNTARHLKSHMGTTACKRLYFCSVFPQRLCQESVSISNMSFPLSGFPVFYWSWQSHIKALREAQKYKEELDPFFTSEGQPGTWTVPLSGPPGFISWWLETEWNRGGTKISDCLWR